MQSKIPSLYQINLTHVTHPKPIKNALFTITPPTSIPMDLILYNKNLPMYESPPSFLSLKGPFPLTLC